MEQLGTVRPRGLSSGILRAWGMVFVVLGIVSRSVIQNGLLGITEITAEELLELMQGSQDVMAYTTLALVFQALEACAIPVFVFLLLEGFRHTSNYRNYLLRVAGLALVSEIPYNLAVSGKVVDISRYTNEAGKQVLDLGTRNPVFALVIALILLYFYNRYSEKTAGTILLKLILAAAALIWTMMLNIDHGAPIVLLACVLWAFRSKPLFRSIAGACVMMLYTITSASNLYYMVAPLAFLFIHFHNGEQGAGNKIVNYAIYPAALLIIALVSMFAI